MYRFCDASEHAYAAVVYLRFITSRYEIQVSLVTSETKVSPIKWLSIIRFELYWAHLLAQLLHHVRLVLEIPLSQVYVWTDSTVYSLELAWWKSQMLKHVSGKLNIFHHGTRSPWQVNACKGTWQPCWLCFKRSISFRAYTATTLLGWSSLAQSISCWLANSISSPAKWFIWRREVSFLQFHPSYNLIAVPTLISWCKQCLDISFRGKLL